MDLTKVKTYFLFPFFKTDVLLLVSCSLVFLIPAIIKVYHSDFSIDELIVGVDDWNRHARHALDIKNNGLLLEKTIGNYLIPAGFLYNYFVAMIFFLFGENPGIVYVVQSLLLGISVAVSFFTFRSFLNSKVAYLFLGLMILFGFIDVYKYYTFRLLSENLAIFTLTLFCFFVKKFANDKTFKLQFIVGVLLGLTQLIRPNIILFCLIFVSFLIFRILFNKNEFRSYWLLLLSFILTISLLPLRNFMVTGDFQILPVNGSFFEYMSRENQFDITSNPLAYLVFYLKRTIFCLGYFPILEPKYLLRPHWIVMWLGVFVLLIHYFFNRRTVANFILFVLVLIGAFYLVLILIAPISIYGFKMLIPSLFLVLGVGVLGFEKLYYKLLSFVKKRNKTNK